MDLTKKRRLDENGGVVLDAITDYSLTTKLTPVDARKMMERFTHEQLLDVLQDAVVRHPDVLDAVRSVADSDITQRKLFVRGLGWETTTESLRSLFSAYGQLEEAVVILDKNTGKSKGYGFVIFKHVDGALLALKEPSKKIDGRVTVTQLASAGANSNSNSNNSSSNHPAGADVSMRKIYVGNVPYEMPADKLLGIFAQYGEIEEGPLGFDKQTGKSKGFALFVYKTPEGAQAALLEPDKLIDGRRLNCKLAIDGKKGKPAGGGGGQVPAGNVLGDGMGMGYGQQGPYAAPPLQTGGMGSYSGFSGGPPPLAGNQLNTSLGGPGFGSHSQQQGSGYGGAGVGAAYGGYGSGPGGPGYGGFGSGGAGFASATGLSVGPFTDGSSVYRFPPSSVGMPSGGYQEAGPYSLTSTSGPFPTQHQGTSPAPRVTSGGMYPHLPPYH